jgi:uncharacterized repeat protein (TIGR01451 family)
MIGLDPTRCDGGAPGTWGANIAVASDLPGVSPTLGGLALNAPGVTPTHALLAGSRGIDEGGNCQATDQRGVTRPQDGDAVPDAVCDMGAYEYGIPDLAVALTDTPDPVAPNGTITFTLTVTNNGGAAVAAGVNVTATLDGTLINLSALPAGCVGPLPTITCTTAGILAAGGGSESWTFSADDPGSALGTILNHSASVPVQPGEINAADNTIATTTTVNVVVPPPPAAGGGGGGPAPQILISDPAISKSVSPLYAVIGETVVWTIVVSNPGPYPTANVTIQDAIPATFDIVSVDVSPDTRNNVTINGNDILGDLGVFQPGESATITITTVANDQAQAGEICNSVNMGATIATACVTISPDTLPPTGGGPPPSWNWLGHLILIALVVIGLGWWRHKVEQNE